MRSNLNPLHISEPFALTRIYVENIESDRAVSLRRKFHRDYIERRIRSVNICDFESFDELNSIIISNIEWVIKILRFSHISFIYYHLFHDNLHELFELDKIIFLVLSRQCCLYNLKKKNCYLSPFFLLDLWISHNAIDTTLNIYRVTCNVYKFVKIINRLLIMNMFEKINIRIFLFRKHIIIFPYELLNSIVY